MEFGKIPGTPSLKAAWEHEYKYSALPITAGFAGIPGPQPFFVRTKSRQRHHQRLVFPSN